MKYQAGSPDMIQRDELFAASLCAQRWNGDELPPGLRPPGPLAQPNGATPRSWLRGVVRFTLLLLTLKGVWHGLWLLMAG